MKLSFAVILGLVVLTTCAPVADKKSTEDKNAKVEVRSEDELRELADQEGELQRVPKVKVQSKGIAVETAEHRIETTVNGKTQSKSSAETKVLKPSTGDVLADVVKQQESKQNEGEEPEIKTEIDIPDQGIEQVIEGDINNPMMNPMDFTPRAVAEYLLVSGDLDSFFRALQDLVKSNVMTIEDAGEYEQEVERHYQALLEELENDVENDVPTLEDYYYDDGSKSKRNSYQQEQINREDESTFDLENVLRGIQAQKELDRELMEYALEPIYEAGAGDVDYKLSNDELSQLTEYLAEQFLPKEESQPIAEEEQTIPISEPTEGDKAEAEIKAFKAEPVKEEDMKEDKVEEMPKDKKQVIEPAEEDTKEDDKKST